MLSDINICDCLKKAGIQPSDTVMIHGDAGLAVQYWSIEPNKRLNHLIKQLLEYFSGKGTIVVPTFSYSFTKKEDFYKHKTPSAIGQFSENFRKFPNIQRSNHPIFSVASFGKYAEKFTNSRIDDCFGDNTAFDILYKLNGKIVSLGCQFNKAHTFVHYVEQKFGVSYRYIKNFSGSILDVNKKRQLTTTYNVRDLNIKSLPEMSLFKKVAVENGDLYIGKIGRFPFTSISAQKYMDIATKLLKTNEYALIYERFSNDDLKMTSEYHNFEKSLNSIIKNKINKNEI